MTTAANRLVLASLVAAALLPRASSAQDLDQLNEDLRVETARLEYALEKVQRVQYPVTGDDRRIRKALLKDGRFLMKQAATVPRDAVPQMEELLRLMAEKRDEADRFVDDVRPLWQEQQRRRAEEGAPRSAFAEVVTFHGVVLDVESVLDRLSADEVERVAELRQQGEDLVAGIKEVRESDYRERGRLVGELVRVRQELQALQQAGLSDRRRGHAFVPLTMTRQQWTDVDHVENGFEAMRTRFLPPGSAYVTVKNLTDEARHLFVELEFFTAAGDRTGEGVFETARLEELRPGEVREVLVPVRPTHPQFWEATKGFTIYLD